MRGMAHEVAVFPPPIESTNSKQGSFGSNNSNEPISVLDTRRSPSPSTSISTLSSSFGGGGNGGATYNAATVGVSDNNIQHKWLEYSVPQEMGISWSVANLATTAGGCRKDEWSELQLISAEFELQQKRFGVGLDDWERLLSESGGSQDQDQDQSLLRWISGDVDDTSFSLKQLLQGNQMDENAPPTTVSKNSSPLNLTPQFPSFFPSPYPGQSLQNFNSQMIVNPPPQQPAPPPPPPPLQVQFHQSGLQKPPAFDQSHEFLLKKQNQQLSLHQQRSMMAAVAKQEPLSPPGAAAPPPHHHQKQLICDQLYTAAELMLSGNFSHAQGILARLNHQLLPSGLAPYKPIERSGFYFKEALQMQMDFLISKRVVPTPSNGMMKMCAYKVLSEVSPIIQFMNFTSNQTLLEALGDADYIHIIDFDIGFGVQWASFIQELPRRKNTNASGGCSLKITAFASPSTHHPVELGLMHENLSQFAQETGISLELEVVNFDCFDPNSFSVSGKAAVGVNFPIWSTSTHLAAIPSILHLIKQLSPRIVVSLDRGCERTDVSFPQYLMEGLEYYEGLLESIDAANIPSYTANKMEKFLLQPEIESMVMGKVEFPEPMAHWKTLFTAGGYWAVGLSNFAEAQAECVVKRSEVRGFGVEKRHGSLVLCWQKRQLMAASAWKC